MYIPTGAFISIVYSKFTQKYWWLRSPYTGWGGAYCVYPAGYIYPDGTGVDNSYGSLRSRLVPVEYYVLIWMVKLTTIMADMVSIPVTIPTAVVGYHDGYFISYRIFSLSGHVHRRHCLDRAFIWPCLLRLQQCRRFLRSISLRTRDGCNTAWLIYYRLKAKSF